MDENDFDDYERDAELALYREYRDVLGTFKYVIETERRFYLANRLLFRAKHGRRLGLGYLSH